MFQLTTRIMESCWSDLARTPSAAGGFHHVSAHCRGRGYRRMESQIMKHKTSFGCIVVDSGWSIMSYMTFIGLIINLQNTTIQHNILDESGLIAQSLYCSRYTQKNTGQHMDEGSNYQTSTSKQLRNTYIHRLPRLKMNKVSPMIALPVMDCHGYHLQERGIINRFPSSLWGVVQRQGWRNTNWSRNCCGQLEAWVHQLFTYRIINLC